MFLKRRSIQDLPADKVFKSRKLELYGRCFQSLWDALFDAGRSGKCRWLQFIKKTSKKSETIVKNKIIEKNIKMPLPKENPYVDIIDVPNKIETPLDSIMSLNNTVLNSS